MGADIHMFIEKAPIAKRRDEIISSLLSVKKFDIKENWELIKSEVSINRNYNLFGRLAGVRIREGMIPLSYPRGIPNDASEDYLKECKDWGSDGHSHSFFYLSELVKKEWLSISQEMHELIENLKKEYEDLDNIRIVFFFDN